MNITILTLIQNNIVIIVTMIAKIITILVILGYTVETRNIGTRVCVIGAGISGLTSARYLKDEGINVTVFEATRYVGGTWRYEERRGLDEYGQPIYTSMYRSLRTNLPKPTMELHDFPMPEDAPSFATGQMFYNYINSYADHFNLKQYIKFQHVVISVKRVGDVWKVKHKYIPTGEEFEEDYDHVIVASGINHKPHMPNIPGEEIFKGTIIHSHDYREHGPYKCKRVLIIGGGPSGLDIGIDVAHVSKTLVHSHHLHVDYHTAYPVHYKKKPDVKEFNKTGAIFEDGSYEDIDDVIYCTGFEFYYPFLDESSGLTISWRSVVPLYRQIVNINQPTMLVIGTEMRACLVAASDAQARYAMAFIKGNFTHPTRDEMMDEWQKRRDLVRSPSQIHYLGNREDEYYAGLSSEAGVFRVPPVIFKMRIATSQDMPSGLYSYRNYVYNVINNETFTKTLINDFVAPKYDSCVNTPLS